ncbi:MAG: monofunctional biosynthetic peptidoglycan transglycosylase [Chitinophagia bacterium]|nr:monofunctional biosynthetic peptidoglycan transglycosylase [Chitinophagia bacterium]
MSSNKKHHKWIPLKLVGSLLGASLLYLVLCIWLLPPITLTQLSDVFSPRGLHRHYVGWSKISPNIKLAAIASEDQRFLEHNGFDWKSIDKSMNGKPSRRKKKLPKGAGASTISQQTAKNVFLWQGSGWGRYIRKVPEFFYTQLIEWTWGKKRILEVYLNVIEMGPGIYGVEEAAQTYFHKHASELNAQEAAMIIACLPNPKKFTVKPMSRRVSWRAPHIQKQMGYLIDDEDIADFIK